MGSSAHDDIGKKINKLVSILFGHRSYIYLFYIE